MRDTPKRLGFAFLISTLITLAITLEAAGQSLKGCDGESISNGDTIIIYFKDGTKSAEVDLKHWDDEEITIYQPAVEQDLTISWTKIKCLMKAAPGKKKPETESEPIGTKPKDQEVPPSVCPYLNETDYERLCNTWLRHRNEGIVALETAEGTRWLTDWEATKDVTFESFLVTAGGLVLTTLGARLVGAGVELQSGALLILGLLTGSAGFILIFVDIANKVSVHRNLTNIGRIRGWLRCDNDYGPCALRKSYQ